MRSGTFVTVVTVCLTLGAGQAFGAENQSITKKDILNVLTPKRVFVTAAKYNGDLGGLAGADAKCQAAADAAGLGGIFMAWLSDGLDSPGTRFLTLPLGPYITINGATVAGSYGDLTNGTGNINTPLDITETGASVVAGDSVWTNTGTTGSSTTDLAINTCFAWTSLAQVRN